MVHVPESITYRGAAMHRGVPALALRTPHMATTLASVETREVVHCRFCKLVQFRPSNSHCVKCHRPLDVEEPVRPGPVAVDREPLDPVTEAGLRVSGLVKEIRRAR